MSKGYFLDKLFPIGESIQKQMTDLFINNAIPTFNLKLLPEDDRKKWMELYKKSNRVSKMITDTILSKDKRYQL